MPSEVGLSAPSRRMGIQIYDSSAFPPNGFLLFLKIIFNSFLYKSTM